MAIMDYCTWFYILDLIIIMKLEGKYPLDKYQNKQTIVICWKLSWMINLMEVLTMNISNAIYNRKRIYRGHNVLCWKNCRKNTGVMI